MKNIRNINCLVGIKDIANQSVNAVICDPPYPEISRKYGRMTEVEWFELMIPMCNEIRRVLTPDGSAVFVLQQNMEKIGRLRSWLFEFQLWLLRNWNIVQDVYWFNTNANTTVHTQEAVGLMRPSVKTIVWAGEPNCYRNQKAVLLSETESNKLARAASRHGYVHHPSGHRSDLSRHHAAALRKGGTSPFNMLAMGNSSPDSSQSRGHGASTPMGLADWWVRYLTRDGDTVLDPFMGGGTILVAALRRGRNVIGFETMTEYYQSACEWLSEEEEKMIIEPRLI